MSASSVVQLLESAFQNAGCVIVRTTVVMILMKRTRLVGGLQDLALSLSSGAMMDDVFLEIKFAMVRYNAVMGWTSRNANCVSVHPVIGSVMTVPALLRIGGATDGEIAPTLLMNCIAKIILTVASAVRSSSSAVTQYAFLVSLCVMVITTVETTQTRPMSNARVPLVNLR